MLERTPKLITVQGPDIFGGNFESLFRSQLEGSYGDQTGALNKMEAGQDRTTYCLGEITDPLGVLVIKDVITKEAYAGGFSIEGVEIKTLTLFNPDENSGRGLASILIAQAFKHAKSVSAGDSHLFVTVASDKPESRTFFGKHGFEIAHEIPEAYREGNTEAVMVSNSA